MGNRENKVVAACIKVLELRGIPWLRNNSGMAMVRGKGGKMRPMDFGKSGWPDLIGILPDGRFLGVEAKAPAIPGLWRKKPAGKLSDTQRAVHQQLLRNKALIITCTSSAEMVKDLESEGYGR